MYMIVCFLGLNQHNDSLSSSFVLDLVFSNIKDSVLSVSYFYMVILVHDCKLT
jgi:hypothetical protein